MCVASNTLRILTIQRLGEIFNQQTIKLGMCAEPERERERENETERERLSEGEKERTRVLCSLLNVTLGGHNVFIDTKDQRRNSISLVSQETNSG